jgi:hypothetical protein
MSSSIFNSFKETGYSKQLLTIGVTECEKLDSDETHFFELVQNFELNIAITPKVTEKNALIYL